MQNFDGEIKNRVVEINKLLGKKMLSNLTYDDLKIYYKSGKRKEKGVFVKKKLPFVVITIPRIDKFLGEGSADRYKVGHRIVIPFTSYSEEDFNIKSPEVMKKIMNSVSEHAKTHFGLDEVKSLK